MHSGPPIPCYDEHALGGSLRGVALTLGDRTLYRLSVDDIDRMLVSGVLTEDTPVELLEGVLVDAQPKSAEHSAVLAGDR